MGGFRELFWALKRPSGPRPADTERTPTLTHRFPSAQGSPGRPLLSFPVFPFGHRTPVPAAGSPGRRGFENHRPKTDHTYETSPFSLFLRVLCTPNIRHTYVHSLSPLAITIALYHSYTGLCLRLFDLPFPTSWCTNLWNPAPEFPGFTLFRFGELTLIR